jgi:hypothetical protein
MSRFLLSLGVVVVMAALVRADNEGPIPATLHPAAMPSPALKYRLLPNLRVQTPGNAVPLYEEAMTKLKPLRRDADESANWQERFYKWTEAPLKDFPRDEVRKALEPYKEILELAAKAARREYCDWDLAKRLRKGGIATLLPEVDFLRPMGTLLALRARLEIADGNLTAAVQTLQTGLALAKQIGEQPTLVNNLVGCAIAQSMLRQVDDFVQHPKAPNLYWALTDLPQPLVDHRKSFEGERLWVYGTFPGIGESMADLDAGPITEEQVQACVKFLIGTRMGLNLIETIKEEGGRRLKLTKYLTDHYEENKKVLLDQGRPKDKVEKMPHVQVALLAEMNAYEQIMDEMMKWYNEPYYKIADQLEKWGKVLPKGTSILPEDGLNYLIPAVGKIFAARARLQRKVDILRCVEAIRAYAAAHDGKLPAALDAIQAVPIPIDAATGKAFAYKVNGDKATLEAPAVDGGKNTASFQEVVYEITITRS